jgi:hypothetical protein
MADMWLAEQGVQDTMRDLIRKYHPDLALIEEEIAVIFKEKASVSGTVKIMSKTSKASPLINLLANGKKWTFVITLASDAWLELNPKQQVALLDHNLCSLRVEEGDDGKQKFSIAVPDVAFFKDEIERHGMWRTSGVAPTKTLVEEIFGVA